MIRQVLRVAVFAATFAAMPLLGLAQETDNNDADNPSLGQEVGQSIRSLQKMYGKGGVIDDIIETDGENLDKIIDDQPDAPAPESDSDFDTDE